MPPLQPGATVGRGIAGIGPGSAEGSAGLGVRRGMSPTFVKKLLVVAGLVGLVLAFS